MGKFRIISPTGWGTPGDVIELDDDEGKRGIESGIVIAVEAKERAVVEAPVERAVEDRAKPSTKPKKRRSKRG